MHSFASTLTVLACVWPCPCIGTIASIQSRTIASTTEWAQTRAIATRRHCRATAWALSEWAIGSTRVAFERHCVGLHTYIVTRARDPSDSRVCKHFLHAHALQSAKTQTRTRVRGHIHMTTRVRDYTHINTRACESTYRHTHARGVARGYRSSRARHGLPSINRCTPTPTTHPTHVEHYPYKHDITHATHRQQQTIQMRQLDGKRFGCID